MPLISVALTVDELFTSPTKKPIDTDVFREPLTPISEIVARRLSEIFTRVTITSLPAATADALPIGAPATSTEVTLPAAVIGSSN